MSENKQSSKQRRFPWKTLDPYPNKKANYHAGARSGGIYVDAQTGQWFFLVLGLPWIIVGTGFALAGKSFPFSVICFIIGILLSLVGIYCFFSRREELKKEAEEKALRDEKQRLWREKRRAERNAKKKK